MKGLMWVVALQILALAVIAHRFSQEGISFLPFWTNSEVQKCGLVHASEYVVTSRRVVLPDGMKPAAVKVKDGKIADIAELHGAASQENLEQAAALKFGLKTVLNYGDLIISPGLIDTHVHLNEPGREHWEGFMTGTKAAAVGGTTTTILMPLNALPAIVTGELLDAKIAASEGKLWVDVGFWGGLVPENANNYSTLDGLLAAGALGFKSFMSPSGIVDFGTINEQHVEQALPFLKSRGVPFYVHAEKVDDTYFQGPVRSHNGWMNSRPAYFEELAIQALVDALGNDTSEGGPGFKLHIAHLSSATGIPIIEKARGEGLPVSVETCPHYLNFADEDVPEGDTRYKCAPPLRTAKNQEELLKYLLEGKINMIASDHSPAPPDMKLVEEGDFKSSWGGIAGLQYNLPSSWQVVKSSGLGPEFLAKVWSEAPAKMANIADQKGSIRPGLDADFTVWDPDQNADTSRAALQHKHKDTVYENMSLAGKVVATFVRGQQVFTTESQLSPKPCGKTLLRQVL